MKRFPLAVGLAAFLVCSTTLGVSLLAVEDRVEIRGEESYTYGDNESLLAAKETARSLAIRRAIESYRVFVEATSKVQDLKVVNDLIQTISTGYLYDLKVDMREDGRTLRAKVKAYIRSSEVKALLFPSIRPGKPLIQSSFSYKDLLRISGNRNDLWDVLAPLLMFDDWYEPPEHISGSLRGIVREIRVETAELRFENGKWIETERRHRGPAALYDRNGNLVSLIVHHRETSEYEKITVTYGLEQEIALVRTESFFHDAAACVAWQKIQIPEAATWQNCPHLRVHAITVNGQGKKIEDLYQYSDPDMSSRREFKYHANGDRIEEIYYDGYGQLVARFVYVYETVAQELKTRVYRSDKSRGFQQELYAESVAQLDSRGRKVREDYSSRISGATNTTTTEYSEGDSVQWQAQTTLTTSVPLLGTVNKIGKRVVDGKGRLLEETNYNDDGSIQDRSVNRYDADGRIQKVILSTPGQPDRDLLQASYDIKGRATHLETSMLYGTLVAISWTYDANGNERESTIKLAGMERTANVKHAEYVFDSEGNWIKKQTTESRRRDNETFSAMTRDPDFSRLSPQGQEDLARKVLFQLEPKTMGALQPDAQRAVAQGYIKIMQQPLTGHVVYRHISYY